MKEKSRFEVFDSLTKKRRSAVVMLSQPNTKQVEVAKALSLSEATLSRWIRAPEFQKALAEYEEFTFSKLRTNAIATMSGLLNARSEMVRYNAASYILDKTMNERKLIDAQIRKANVEADIAEAKAAILKGSGDAAEDKTVLVDDVGSEAIDEDHQDIPDD